jgi:hypothetical protein
MTTIDAEAAEIAEIVENTMIVLGVLSVGHVVFTSLVGDGLQAVPTAGLKTRRYT